MTQPWVHTISAICLSSLKKNVRTGRWKVDSTTHGSRTSAPVDRLSYFDIQAAWRRQYDYWKCLGGLRPAPRVGEWVRGQNPRKGAKRKSKKYGSVAVLDVPRLVKTLSADLLERRREKDIPLIQKVLRHLRQPHDTLLWSIHQSYAPAAFLPGKCKI